MSNLAVKFIGKTKTCKVEIDYGISNSLPSIVNKSTAYIITDKNLVKYHKPYFDRFIERYRNLNNMLVLPSGESTKNYRTQMKIHQWLLDNGADRDSILIGVGGGVICDLVGFAAATFMRGVEHVLVPTTLLAQVDAAIGGKNGINLAEAKNMIGTIKQPMSILVDPVFLSTLSSSHFTEGLSELLKMAFIRSRKLHSLFSKYHGLEDQKILLQMITEGIKSKLAVVRKDQYESGLRKILNFGHTTGHALEVIAGYRRRMPHGKAVAAGILVALELSDRFYSLDEKTLRWGHDRIVQLYKKFPLETSSMDRIWDVIERDKKRTGVSVNFVLLESMFKPVLRPVNKRDFKSAFSSVAKRWSSLR